MRTLTDEELKTWTLKDFQNEIANLVYEAASLLEDLEYKRNLRGNGHHMRQQVAKFAADLLAERWTEVTGCAWCDDPRNPSPECHPNGQVEHLPTPKGTT